MTMILKPKCNIEKLDGLTVLIAKVMKETIKVLYNYDLEIKKPNDLMLNGKKISGILTQINSQAQKINYLIISFGFNVNEINFSKETVNLATSLKQEYGKDFSREDIIINFIEKLEVKLDEII